MKDILPQGGATGALSYCGISVCLPSEERANRSQVKVLIAPLLLLVAWLSAMPWLLLLPVVPPRQSIHLPALFLLQFPSFLFFSYIICLLILFLSFHTVPPEHLPPKCSFPSTCCAWFRYSIPTYLLQTSLLFHALPQCSLTSSIAQPSLPFTVSNKTGPITNPNTVREAHCNHTWEFHLALV